jgi:hypothetical protein
MAFVYAHTVASSTLVLNITAAPAALGLAEGEIFITSLHNYLQKKKHNCKFFIYISL